MSDWSWGVRSGNMRHACVLNQCALLPKGVVSERWAAAGNGVKVRGIRDGCPQRRSTLTAADLVVISPLGEVVTNRSRHGQECFTDPSINGFGMSFTSATTTLKSPFLDSTLSNKHCFILWILIAHLQYPSFVTKYCWISASLKNLTTSPAETVGPEQQSNIV